jgi:hypothetical protein
MISALFWGVTQRRVVFVYRRFGTTYRSHLQDFVDFLTLEPIRCVETSIQDYHSTLRNITEEHMSHGHRGGSLKSGMVDVWN